MMVRSVWQDGLTACGGGAATNRRVLLCDPCQNACGDPITSESLSFGLLGVLVNRSAFARLEMDGNGRVDLKPCSNQRTTI